MRKEVDPNDSSRGFAFELWKTAGMPKVTIFKTFNISRLIKIAKRKGWSTFWSWYIYVTGMVTVRLPLLAWRLMMSGHSPVRNTSSKPFSEAIQILSGFSAA